MFDAVVCGVDARRVGVQCAAPPPPPTRPKEAVVTDAAVATTSQSRRVFEDSDMTKWRITYVQSSWMKLMKKSVVFS